MKKRSFMYACVCAVATAITLLGPQIARGATISVPAGGNLQAALDAARPGDTILLAAGATYVGNFVLPVHGGTSYVTIRTGGNDSLLPATGVRITPSHAPYLAKLRAPSGTPTPWLGALSTAPGAAYWRVMFVEFLANPKGEGDIVLLGDGSSAQNALSQVPHHLIVDRVYIHGDLLHGQKRGIALNSSHTTITNCHISGMKAVLQDSQSIAGTNGPGPYHIENNYLEAAGEMFIMGGDDPKIPGLVPADLTFRRNTLTRPVSWRNPILATPAGVTASPGAGGTLAAGTYGYRVVARRPVGPTRIASSVRSAEVTATVAAGGSVTIRWNAVPNAAEYQVFGRTVGGQTKYWTVTTTVFTDVGAAGTAGTAPSTGTVWQVKNLLELKNIRRVLIDYNLMENNWLAAQNGIAVLFTPRNQNGGCPQCVVEDVTFEYNVVRNVAGGVNILGIDNIHPSKQANNIRIRHNEFSGIDKVLWGGSGYFLNLTDNPRDITVDHNTIVSPNGNGVVAASGSPIYGFVFTNNVARHNSYGIFGSSKGYGNAAISYYFPNGVIRRNVLAGGKASMYPADNLFPTTTDFQNHFVNYAGGDYALVPGTDWAGAGLDSEDLGADIAKLRAPWGSGALQVVTQSLPSTTELAPYSATLQASGGKPPYQWSIISGSLPSGISLDPLTGALSGSAAADGMYGFTVRVTDSVSATASQPLTLQVAAAVPPVQIVTSSLAGATVSVPYSQHLGATGGSGTYTWNVTGGQLPPGITLSTAGDLSGTPTTAGTWSFTATAYDAQDSSRFAARTFSLAVAASQPNQPPAVTLTASRSGVIPVGAPVTLTANASDSDGTVKRVDFFINGAAAGSDTSAPFTLAWVAQNGGPYAATATATDDDGATKTSASLTLNTSEEIVIYASDLTRMVGDYQLVADATAAAGQRLWNPNRNAAKILSASATPANYAEFTFYAEQGRPYRIWIRGKAETNAWANDSAYLQFSGTVDAAGAAVARIGTTGSMWYSLEEYSNQGLQNWGWQDNGYGSAGLVGPSLYFAATGLQTIRIQQREDGLSIDQIVISPSRYFSVAPGLPKGDATIVPKP
jgi:hypothetical protein